VTAKEYLSQYISAGEEIKALCYELERVKSISEKVTVSFESDGGASGSVNVNKIPEAVEKIMDIERDIGERVTNLAFLRIDIYNTICRVQDGKLRVILLKRYIGNESFERIAYEMGYNHHYLTHKIHNDALEEVEKVLKDVPKTT
jgi:hypothetical protein